MTDKLEPGMLPTAGTAEEMIPLLRKRLGLSAPDAAELRPDVKPSPVAPPPDRANERAAVRLSVADALTHDRPHPVLQQSVVQLVTFDLEPERYGVPIEQVFEILRLSSITRVPEAPDYVCGLMNVRGRLLPVIDVRRLLGMPSVTPKKDSRVVMAHVQGRVVGLLVDHVSYVLKLSTASIEPPPLDVIGRRAEYVVGVALHEERMIVVLDVDRAMGLLS